MSEFRKVLVFRHHSYCSATHPAPSHINLFRRVFPSQEDESVCGFRGEDC